MLRKSLILTLMFSMLLLAVACGNDDNPQPDGDISDGDTGEEETDTDGDVDPDPDPEDIEQDIIDTDGDADPEPVETDVEADPEPETVEETELDTENDPPALFDPLSDENLAAAFAAAEDLSDNVAFVKALGENEAEATRNDGQDYTPWVYTFCGNCDGSGNDNYQVIKIVSHPTIEATVECTGPECVIEGYRLMRAEDFDVVTVSFEQMLQTASENIDFTIRAVEIKKSLLPPTHPQYGLTYTLYNEEGMKRAEVNGETGAFRWLGDCTGDEIQCRGTEVWHCDNLFMTLREDCADNGEICVDLGENDVQCASQDDYCVQDETTCEGDKVKFCFYGMWFNRIHCDATDQTCGYDSETGEAVCVDRTMDCDTEGETRCNHDNIETCTDGAFVVTDECSARDEVCDEDPISLEPVCIPNAQQCTEGETKCEGDAVYACYRNHWTEAQDCTETDMVCRMDLVSGEATCVEEIVQPCTDGEARCNGNVIETCVRGLWQSGDDCSETLQECVYDALAQTAECVDVNPGCVDGSQQCNGSVVETCVRGAWQQGDDCADTNQECQFDLRTGTAQCVDITPACDADTQQCNGDAVESCVEGAWQEDQDCADTNQECYFDMRNRTAECVDPAPECSNGEQHCNGSVIETCVLEAWQAGEDCADSRKTCEENPFAGTAQCVDGGLTCTEGDTQCNGTVIETCVRGAWVSGADCSETRQVCMFNMLTETAECVLP